MNAPTISKGNITIFLSHTDYVGIGRIAFLLKSNWKKVMVRKEVKQYQTNLGVLGKSNTNLGFRWSSMKKEDSRNELQEEMKDNDDHIQMNVDKIPDKSQHMRLTDMGFERK